MPLYAMFHAIGRCKRTHDADHCNRYIGRSKSDVHVFDRVGRAFEKRLMHLAHGFQCSFAAAVPPAVRVDVVPILGRIFGRSGETVIEGFVERLDRRSNSSFFGLAHGSTRRK